MSRATAMIGRGLAVIGAAGITWSVTGRDWWSYAGGSTLFEDMTGRLGPYSGTWCSDVFCHDLEMDRPGLGSGYATLGAITFYAGLVLAAVLTMTALAPRARIAQFARASMWIAAITGLAALAVVGTRGDLRGASFEAGLGIPVVALGIVLGIGGCWLATRGPSGPPRPPRPRLGRALVVGASAVALVSLGSTFWKWSWSNERNEVGLVTTHRCWVDPDRTICSDVESVAEIFMLDRDDEPRFVAMAAQTQHVALAAALLALVIALAPVFRRDNRWTSQLGEQAHALWIVVALHAGATAAMTPDVGEARDIHLAHGFALLGVACALGITGHLLARAEPAVPAGTAAPAEAAA